MGDLQDAIGTLKGSVFFYNRYGRVEWEDMKTVIRHSVLSAGTEHVIIDPITCTTDGMESSEANTHLQLIAREIDEMAKDLGFTYYIFCHLNSPSTGPSHERGGKVTSHQFAGSRAMMRACTYMIGIERNKDPELSEDERNTSHFVLLEDRMFGNTCKFPVFYNKETGDYLEPLLGKEF